MADPERTTGRHGVRPHQEGLYKGGGLWGGTLSATKGGSDGPKGSRGFAGSPKRNFKGKSVRKGYATASRDARVEQYRKQALEAMVARGSNWVMGSEVPEAHYIYNYDKVGPFTLMGSWE